MIKVRIYNTKTSSIEERFMNCHSSQVCRLLKIYHYDKIHCTYINTHLILLEWSSKKRNFNCWHSYLY